MVCPKFFPLFIAILIQVRNISNISSQQCIRLCAKKCSYRVFAHWSLKLKRHPFNLLFIFIYMVNITIDFSTSCIPQIGFKPLLHEQSVNDVSTELWSSIKSPRNSTNHRGKGHPPVLLSISAMLSLLHTKHINVHLSWLANTAIEFFHKWHTIIDGVWTLTAWPETQRRCHWAIELNEIAE